MNKNISRPLQNIDYRILVQQGKLLGIDASWHRTGSRVQRRGKPKQKQLTYGISSIQSIIGNHDSDSDDETFLSQDRRIMHPDYNDDETEAMDRLCFKIKPDKLQTTYQVSNINIKEVQDIIHNSDPKSYNQTCTSKEGWILKKDWDKIRALMEQRKLQWIQEENKKNHGSRSRNRSRSSSPKKKNKPKRKQKDKDKDEMDGDMDSCLISMVEVRC